MPNFTRGWIVQLKDGTQIFEGQKEWKEVPKNQIESLSLVYDGRRWDLTDKQAYFVASRASMVPGISASFRVEARTIGFYEGATKVFYTVDELSGAFSIKVNENK